MTTATRIEAPAPGSFHLWERQVAAIFAMEIKKTFFSSRAALLYLMALAPVVLFPLAFLALRSVPNPEWLTTTFATTYQLLILRMVVFFGCAWIFSNLFRAEILDRSLHFHFLVPVRREVLVVGKYLAALLGTMFLFGFTTIATYLSLFVGQSFQVMMTSGLSGSGLATLMDYLATTALACVGYGAVFMVLGIYVRNPFIPAVAIWGWEQINFFLPAVLKKLSIIHYLSSLSPVPFEDGHPLAILADPVPPGVAVAGVLALTVALLTIASLKVRKMEVAYGID